MSQFSLKLTYVLLSACFITTNVNADSCSGQYVIYNTGDNLDKEKGFGKDEAYAAKLQDTKSNLEEAGFVDVNCRNIDVKYGFNHGICCTGISAPQKLCNLLALKVLESFEAAGPTEETGQDNLAYQTHIQIYKDTCNGSSPSSSLK